MKKINKFINRYPLSKTLRFSLLPIGKTEECFDKNMIMQADEHRAESYKKVKKIIDRYHIYYIDSVLSNTVLTGIHEYADVYYKQGKSESDKKMQLSMEENLRKQIANALKCKKAQDKKMQSETESNQDAQIPDVPKNKTDKDTLYSKLFKKEMITDLLPSFITDEDELKMVMEFKNFSTYFSGYHKNRENIYSEEEKSTAVSFRCVNDNLPKFLDNAKNFLKINAALPMDIFTKLNSDFEPIHDCTIEEMFSIDYFNFVLSQNGIDQYNEVLGGYTLADGTKVKGINEYINLFNQTHEKGERLPRLKPLFKQILSDVETISFIPEAFETDNEVLQAINEFYSAQVENEMNLSDVINELVEMFSTLSDYDSKGIYIKNGLAVTELSNKAFGSWREIQDKWNEDYDRINRIKTPKDEEKYLDNRRKAFKRTESISLDKIEKLCGNNTVVEYYSTSVNNLKNEISSNYSKAQQLLINPYSYKKKLCTNDTAIALIKNFLDSIKKLESLVKPLLGTGKEENKDGIFYGKFTSLFGQLDNIDRLYDKVRNYVTQKPYSSEKIRLNFNCSSFLNGWAQDYNSKGAIILEKSGNYYLMIIDKALSEDDKHFIQTQVEQNPATRFIYDFQKPNFQNMPRILIRSKGNRLAPVVEKYSLPVMDIIDIYDNGYYKTEYAKIDYNKFKSSLSMLIDYYKLALPKHESYSHFNFCWKKTDEYNNCSEFYKDLTESCYQLKKEKVNFDKIIELVEQEKVFLFQIYNKDFSAHSKGKPNLHTLYFKMLFDERNLSNVVFQLNGGAQMFYRKSSILEGDQIVHYANLPLDSKNLQNPKLKSTFPYDIIKDRRFTQRQFSLHMPITLNFKAVGETDCNEAIRKELKACDNNYVIGIDRGERNLIYICVVNSNGDIVEQRSLNEIVNSYNGINNKVDYHNLLNVAEVKQKKALQNWTAIENIKELKEGYISQVVHVICDLVIKYDAVIAMEDLNSGFKNSRMKVKKQVYQKFEKMLIDKLNFLADKNADPETVGGLLKAYQLTNKFESFKAMSRQNGMIFYIPAWLTSKIDPVTGFTDLLKPRYTSVDGAKDFFAKFDKISFNSETDMFEFAFDYTNFTGGSVDSRGTWTVCTNGDRIESFRNQTKNNEWDYKTINLTDAFKELFNDFDIDIKCNLKDAIYMQNEKAFFVKILHLLSLTLQMRNSIPGRTDVDYLISPVKADNGEFYDSRNYETIENSPLPQNADANGAYNIARKVLWAIDVLKETDDDSLMKAKLSISNKEWLKYAQSKQ